MNRSHRLLLLLFGFICLTDILFTISSRPELRLYTKPLLMPLLATAFYWMVRPPDYYSRLLLGALFFSWAGDVLLLFEARNEYFFIGGLASFLTAHLLYITYFLSIPSSRPSFYKKRPFMLLVVPVYVFELLYLLWAGLGNMKIPVTLYALVIGAMLLLAMWQYQRLDDAIALPLIAGAFFFVLSDSLLAINRFRKPFPFAGPLVMATYCLAQFMLVTGSARFIFQHREKQKLPNKA